MAEGSQVCSRPRSRGSIGGVSTSGIADEKREQLVLERGKRYLSTAYPNLAPNEVDDEITGNKARLLTGRLEAVPECRPYSRQQLLPVRERLRYIIIHAEIERPDLRALIEC